MTRVQVYGPPEDRMLEHDECLCEDDTGDALVVFHPAAVQLTAGGWSCAGCAFSAAPSGGVDR